MKKKVLIPLLVAGMMVASVMSLDSCKKNQEQQKSLQVYFEDGDAPCVEEVFTRDDGAELICPYCDVPLLPGDIHWHAFGPKPDNIPASAFDEGEPFGVADCSNTIGMRACLYSGLLEGNEAVIRYLMDTLHVTHDVGYAMTKPRFHGHLIRYNLFGPDGGMDNHWHVGGGLPWWPIPPILDTIEPIPPTLDTVE